MLNARALRARARAQERMCTRVRMHTYARMRTCICEQARVARICAHRRLYASERATLACIRTLVLSAGPERSGGEKFFTRINTNAPEPDERLGRSCLYYSYLRIV